MRTCVSNYCPFFRMANLSSTAWCLVIGYNKVEKRTMNHSNSLSHVDKTYERIYSCRYKTKIVSQ